MLWHVMHTAADEQCLPVCLICSALDFYLKKPRFPLHCSGTLGGAKSLCTTQREAVDCTRVSFGTWRGSSRSLPPAWHRLRWYYCLWHPMMNWVNEWATLEITLKKKKDSIFNLDIFPGIISTCTDTPERTKNEQVEVTYMTLPLKNRHV